MKRKPKEETRCSNNPQHIDEITWYYENLESLQVVREVYQKGRYVLTETFNIPFKKISQSYNKWLQMRKNKNQEGLI